MAKASSRGRSVKKRAKVTVVDIGASGGKMLCRRAGREGLLPDRGLQVFTRAGDTLHDLKLHCQWSLIAV